MAKNKRPRWRRKTDSIDVWWEADIPIGPSLINVMVDDFGYTIADGGGETIAERGILGENHPTGKDRKKILANMKNATSRLLEIVTTAQIAIGIFNEHTQAKEKP